MYMCLNKCSKQKNQLLYNYTPHIYTVTKGYKGYKRSLVHIFCLKVKVTKLCRSFGSRVWQNNDPSVRRDRAKAWIIDNGDMKYSWTGRWQNEKSTLLFRERETGRCRTCHRLWFRCLRLWFGYLDALFLFTFFHLFLWEDKSRNGYQKGYGCKQGVDTHQGKPHAFYVIQVTRSFRSACFFPR